MIRILKQYFKIIISSGVKKKKLLILFFTSLITVFFEFVGVGIFIPLLNLLTKKSNDLIFFGNTLSFNTLDKYNFYLKIATFVFFIFLLKSLLIIINTSKIAKFWKIVDQTMKDRVYKVIMNQDYKDFISKSSSSYLNLIIVEVEKFSEISKYILTLVVEISVTSLIFIALFFYDFRSAIIVLSFVISFTSIFYLIFKRKLIQWGKFRQMYQDVHQNNLKSSLTNYFFIKVNGGFQYFSKNFNEPLKFRNDNMAKSYVFENIPRAFLEVIGLIILILSGILLKYVFNTTINEILAFIVLLLISFYRILPSLNRILTSYNIINFSLPVIKIINDILRIERKYNFKYLNEINNIELKNLTFNYDNKRNIISNLNLVINKGDIIGVFGESGKGKSTLIKLIIGLIKDYEGTIKYDSKDLKKLGKYRFDNIFGYVEQNVKTFNSSLEENITLLNTLNTIQKEWYQNVLKICKLELLSKKLKSKKIIEGGVNISGGEMQRIGLAKVLFKKPDILILDEFTSALDDKNKSSILESIEFINTEFNKTIILISHDISLKKICNKIIQL